MIQTRYTRDKAPRDIEPGGGKSIVETSGYVPADVRIKELLMAGVRLADYRAERYDWPQGSIVDEDKLVDPTRRPGYDMADAAQAALAIKARAANVSPPKDEEEKEKEEEKKENEPT